MKTVMITPKNQKFYIHYFIPNLKIRWTNFRSRLISMSKGRWKFGVQVDKHITDTK